MTHDDVAMLVHMDEAPLPAIGPVCYIASVWLLQLRVNNIQGDACIVCAHARMSMQHEAARSHLNTPLAVL